jgi:hypothetical protein
MSKSEVFTRTKRIEIKIGGNIIAYPNLLGTKGYVVVVVLAETLCVWKAGCSDSTTICNELKKSQAYLTKQATIISTRFD